MCILIRKGHRSTGYSIVCASRVYQGEERSPLIPALAPRFNLPRRDGVCWFGYFGSRILHCRCSTLPQSELLVQLVGFFSYHIQCSFSSNLRHLVVIRTRRRASSSTVHSHLSVTLSEIHPTQCVRVLLRLQSIWPRRV